MRLLKTFVVLFMICNMKSAWPQSGGQWHERVAMPTPRQEIPLASLGGKIYVAGGLDATAAVTTTVEIYDTATNSWNTGVPLPAPMHHHHIVALNGKLYVLGGFIGQTFSGSAPTNRVFEFDPEILEWNEKKKMPSLRGAGAAIAYGGKIFVIGGLITNQEQSLNEMYDPLTDTWETRANMPTPREHLAGASIDSLIYIIGGRKATTLENFGVLQAYSPGSDEWTTLALMPTPRGGLSATAVQGRLYVFGGEFFEDGSGVFKETEEYTPGTNLWRELAPMPIPRHGTSAVTVVDSIFIIGGATRAGLGATGINAIFIPPGDLTNIRGEDGEIPADFSLEQNFPNPFNPSTTITFSLPDDYRVVLKVYDLLGNSIREILNSQLGAGEHRITWDATGLATGVYFYRLEAREANSLNPAFSQIRKMLLVR